MAMAQLCSSCAYDRDKCVKCGGYVSNGAMAQLCSSCAYDRDKCVKCGGYC